MGDVGMGISQEHFLLQPGQAGENEQDVSVQGSLKSAHCRKQAPLKPFLSVCIPTTLRRKPLLFFFPVLCKANTLIQPYPVLGRSVGERPVLGSCLLQAVQSLAFSFLATWQKHSEAKMMVPRYSIFLVKH